jgi:hypothetical protein
MSAPSFAPLLSAINFSSAGVAVLAGFVLLIGFMIVVKGGKIILKELGIDGSGKWYQGRHYDDDVYDSAMGNLEEFKSRGGKLDRESASALKEWRNDKARDGLF